MTIDETTLTKGQVRKLNALRKSIGEKIGEDAFSKWLKNQSSEKPAETSDPVAEKLLESLKSLESPKSLESLGSDPANPAYPINPSNLIIRLGLNLILLLLIL